MPDSPASVVIALLALVVGVVVGVLVGRRSGVGDAATRAAVAEARLDELGRAADEAERRHAGDLVRLDDQHRRALAAHDARLREVQQRLADEQSSSRARDAGDGRVLTALAPVADTIRVMQGTIAQLEAERRSQFGALGEQLRSAAESEERLRSTAEQLASALRSNSTRGVWGETQLRSVVEAAGLLERVDFDVQTTIAAESGGGRPDMVVRLPGGKSIAVDAKVPFAAYLEASAIPIGADGAEGARRTALVAEHVKALRAHVTALGAKGYWSGLDSSPELVVAFIPSESLVSSALAADPSLLEFAFGKRVALASPVTLWSVLKTVAFSWQQDVLTTEAKELFDLSRDLYGRLCTTAGRIDKLGRSIRSGVNDYNTFVGSLERTVLPAARRLGALDESKVLASPAPVDETPRSLSAPELVAVVEAGSAADAQAAHSRPRGSECAAG